MGTNNEMKCMGVFTDSQSQGVKLENSWQFTRASSHIRKNG